jgi:hypothetical protein
LAKSTLSKSALALWRAIMVGTATRAAAALARRRLRHLLGRMLRPQAARRPLVRTALIGCGTFLARR